MIRNKQEMGVRDDDRGIRSDFCGPPRDGVAGLRGDILSI